MSLAELLRDAASARQSSAESLSRLRSLDNKQIKPPTANIVPGAQHQKTTAVI